MKRMVFLAPDGCADAGRAHECLPALSPIAPHRADRRIDRFSILPLARAGLHRAFNRAYSAAFAAAREAPWPARPGADRLDDVVVAGAAADIALELLADRVLVEVVALAIDDVDRRHDHARRAEAALQAVMLAERLLHRMQLAALRQALDRRDIGALACEAASVVQDFIARPSICTTQAPHWLVSQPTWVPVRRRCSRRNWTSKVRGSTFADTALPLTVMET